MLPIERVTTFSSGTGSTFSGSSGGSVDGKPRTHIQRSTGRGGSGNIKRKKDGDINMSSPSDRAAVIGGREAPPAGLSTSKRIASGRGGSGNIRVRSSVKAPPKTAAIISQFESPIRDYEREVIAASAERRQRNAGNSGRGGAGNNYEKKAKSPISSPLTSPSPSGNSRNQPRKVSVSREIMSKLKFGKSKKKKNDHLPPLTGTSSFSTTSYGTTSFSSSDVASVVDIRPLSTFRSVASTPALTDASSLMPSDTSTFAPWSDAEEPSEAHKRLGIILLEEHEEHDDDESIYLAYARDDNAEDDIIYEDDETEESDEAGSDIEDGASICFEASGIRQHHKRMETIVETDSEPSTPRASEPVPLRTSFDSPFGYPSPTTPGVLTRSADDEEDEVDPSLRIMRARYSMARYYDSSPTPSTSRELPRDMPVPSPSPSPSPYIEGRRRPSPLATLPSHSLNAPTWSSTSPYSPSAYDDASPRTSTSPAAMQNLLSALQLPSGISSISGLPTPQSSPIFPSVPLAGPQSSPPRQSLRPSAKRPIMSRLSATDLAMDATGEEALPPYTPKATEFQSSAPPTRLRPLPTTPTTSHGFFMNSNPTISLSPATSSNLSNGGSVQRLLDLPPVPQDAPRGPRRPARILTRQSQLPPERDSIAETMELASSVAWPSPPTSSSFLMSTNSYAAPESHRHARASSFMAI